MDSAYIEIDNTADDPRQKPELVTGGLDFAQVTEKVCSVAEGKKMPLAWWIALGVSFALLVLFLSMLTYLIVTGVGVWGNNNPVMWGFPIINFVFWVGIGHAGTLISAILFLFRQKWRTGINRFAETMTCFAVLCAGAYPMIHVGRIWVAYYMFPLPNQMGMWPNFRSPLLWDVAA